MMIKNLGRTLTSSLLYLSILIVCLNSWLAFRAVYVLTKDEQWVAHTWQVKQAAEQVLSSMKDAETGDRGYLLTGDPAYLAPYTLARSVMPAELASLQQLTVDNTTQQQTIADVRRLIAMRLGLLEQAIAAREQGPSHLAKALTMSGPGKVEMDRLRLLIGTMQNEEQRLLVVRMKESAHAQQRAYFTVAIAGLLNLIFISLAIWNYRRERQLRETSERNADRLQRLQSISEVGISQLTVSELTQALLQRLRTVVDADASLLCRYEDGQLEVTASNGLPLMETGPYRIPAESLLGIAAENQRTLNLGRQDIDDQPVRGLHGQLRSLLVLPLTVSGRTMALLLVGRRTIADRAPLDESLLSIIADRIAIAMDRARAYEAEREARRVAEQNALEVQLLNEQLEERVKQRTAELEATNRELEAFSYSVSHDLRAPLRSVDGFSAALVEDFGDVLNGEARDYIARIRRGVQRMGQLIDSLLQLSRITRAELVREPFNLSTLVEEVTSDIAAQHPDRTISFVIQPDLEVDGDPKLLRIALENLIGNAVKFTSRRPDAVIEFGISPAREYFISDNGAGFDMQYASKLFNAFQRLHGDKDFVGSGIGLATVARIIRRHRGHIRAEGQIGRGAVFSFTLG